MNGRNKAGAYLGLAGRLLAGGVFLYAGFTKAAAPAEEFAFAIESYKVFPEWFALLSARLVPWLELALGAFLALGIFTRAAALAVGGMLVFFQGLLFSAVIRQLPVTNCGCFGSAGNPIEVEIGLNFVWLLCAYAAFRDGARLYSLDAAAGEGK